MGTPLLESLEKLVRRPVPEATRQRTTRHLVDWLSCAAAGATTPAGAAFRAAGEIGDIIVLGQDVKLTPRSAAFTMGAFGNPLEMDDLDRAAILHPGPVIMPAALAAAQIGDTSPNVLLDGIVKGYDAMIRLGRSVGPAHYAKFHNTATCGPLGAAVATAHIFGLDPDQTLWAMGNALTQAAGFWACRHEDVMTKQLHTARAAEAGLAAALLAQAGVSGPRWILEGAQGFYEGMCPDPKPESLLAEPQAWRIHEVSFKPWPACRHCHPAIDAAIALRENVEQPDRIVRVRIEVYRDAAIFCNKPDPQTTIDAKFSLQHAVGVTLLEGPPDLNAFEDVARNRNDVSAFRQHTDVVVDPSLTAAYPEHFGAKLTLHLADGSALSEFRADATGDPELPMDDEQLIAKATSLMAWGGVPSTASKELIDRALHLASIGSLAPFFDAVRRARPEELHKIA